MPEQNLISEYQMQVSFFDEIRLMANSEPRLKWVHSSLNGIKLPIGLAVKAKKSGMPKGVWDVFLPEMGNSWPHKSSPFNGLYGEFKVKGNYLTKEQRQFRDDLNQLFFFDVWHSAEEGVESVKNYLGIK